MKKADPGLYGGIAILAIAIMFFIYALTYEYTSEIGPGPGFFPIWLSGILLILAILYLYQSIKGNDSSEKMPDRQGRLNILLIVISMILYVALLRPLGFIVCSAAFLFAMLIRPYTWKIALPVSVGTSAGLYALFVFFLGVQLPRNILGF